MRQRRASIRNRKAVVTSSERECSKNEQAMSTTATGLGTAECESPMVLLALHEYFERKRKPAAGIPVRTVRKTPGTCLWSISPSLLLRNGSPRLRSPRIKRDNGKRQSGKGNMPLDDYQPTSERSRETATVDRNFSSRSTTPIPFSTPTPPPERLPSFADFCSATHRSSTARGNLT